MGWKSGAAAALRFDRPAKGKRRENEQDIMEDELGAPPVVDRRTFQAELDALRVREKAHTHEGDAIAAARRRLPMVEVPASTLLMVGSSVATFRGSSATGSVRMRRHPGAFGPRHA